MYRAVSEREALWAAILADRYDDLPRLVYADKIEETPESRKDPLLAEFIRLQIEHERAVEPPTFNAGVCDDPVNYNGHFPEPCRLCPGCRTNNELNYTYFHRQNRITTLFNRRRPYVRGPDIQSLMYMCYLPWTLSDADRSRFRARNSKVVWRRGFPDELQIHPSRWFGEALDGTSVWSNKLLDSFPFTKIHFTDTFNWFCASSNVEGPVTFRCHDPERPEQVSYQAKRAVYADCWDKDSGATSGTHALLMAEWPQVKKWTWVGTVSTPGPGDRIRAPRVRRGTAR